jgi:hypothetical protein
VVAGVGLGVADGVVRGAAGDAGALARALVAWAAPPPVAPQAASSPTASTQPSRARRSAVPRRGPEVRDGPLAYVTHGLKPYGYFVLMSAWSLF